MRGSLCALMYIGCVYCGPAWGAELETVEIEAEVTAYGPEDGDGDYKTSTGVDVLVYPRGIAADPKLIPYGSRCEVPGYGEARVDDTGSAMRRAGRKGKILIDVRFATEKEAIEWGRQTLKIKVTRWKK